MAERNDPFRGRLNFPCFEDAMREGRSRSNSPPSPGEQSTTTSTTTYSALSIGARAALNEHLRHVARFGIDNSHSSSSDQHQRQQDEGPRDPRDELWERLQDASPNISHTASDSVSMHSTGFRLERILHQSTETGLESLEVLPDQSSDFFDSSRVEGLLTPERNREHINAVTTRQSFGSSSPDTSDDEPTMLNLFKRAHGEQLQTSFGEDPFGANEHSFMEASGGNDHSFSLSAVDLSRISADGSDIPRRSSPNSSFDHRGTIEELQHMSTFEAAVAAAAAAASGIHHPHFKEEDPPPRVTPLRKTPPRPSPPPSRENFPNFADALALSPIGSRRSRQRRPREIFGNLKAPTTSWPVMEDFAESSMVVEYPSSQHDDVSPLHSSSSKKNTSSGSSSMENTTTSAPSFPPGDRRHYRTVVPSRVFLKEPDDFPEDYDSFSAPPPSRRKNVAKDERSRHTSP